MQTIDLNTGETSQAPREDFADSLIEDLRAHTFRGGPVPGRKNFAVRVERHGGGGAIFTVSCRNVDMTAAGLAWTRGGARMLWPRLQALHDKVFHASLDLEPPDDTPWLAVLHYPPVVYGHSCRRWVDDFCRAFAWAMLDERLFA